MKEAAFVTMKRQLRTPGGRKLPGNRRAGAVSFSHRHFAGGVEAAGRFLAGLRGQNRLAAIFR